LYSRGAPGAYRNSSQTCTKPQLTAQYCLKRNEEEMRGGLQRVGKTLTSAKLLVKYTRVRAMVRKSCGIVMRMCDMSLYDNPFHQRHNKAWLNRSTALPGTIIHQKKTSEV
jgi:hypothetical protein